MAPVWEAQAQPLRLCFRRSESRERRPWRLEFLLQAEDDPSLQVLAGKVWACARALKSALARKLARPDEFLLDELRRAPGSSPRWAPP